MRIPKLLRIAAVLLLIVILFAIWIGLRKPAEKASAPEGYTLRSYRNAVALYEGDRRIAVYESVVLNALPIVDRERFDQGIAFATRAEAERLLEDYDG